MIGIVSLLGCYDVKFQGQVLCGECQPLNNTGCPLNQVCLDNGQCQNVGEYQLFNQLCDGPATALCGQLQCYNNFCVVCEEGTNDGLGNYCMDGIWIHKVFAQFATDLEGWFLVGFSMVMAAFIIVVLTCLILNIQKCKSFRKGRNDKEPEKMTKFTADPTDLQTVNVQDV